ncbi:MAG: hypothetical protein ACRD8O_22980 [Bryobacteraceae bacterium]
MPALSASTVRGSIQLVESRDPNVRRNSDYSGVVVWLERADGAPAPTPPRTATMIQRKKMFTPHVLAVPVGATVDWPNLDPIFHNAFSNFSGQPFDVGLYPPKTSQKVVFRREGVVRVFCNIHPTMSAVIVVVRTPYVAVSSRTGEFSIENVPPGVYRLRIFHERSLESTLSALEQRVTVAAAPVTVSRIAISESGYLQAPHSNKFGKDYPPVVEDQAMYYAGRKP